MSFVEGIQLMVSTGILSGGVGVLKWAMGIERRVIALELKTQEKEG
jgi:hypothetical protein